MTTEPAPRFRIGDAISFGWSAFWRNIGPLVLFALITLLVSAALAAPQFVAPESLDEPAPLLALNLLNFLVNSLIAMGWLKITLDIVDHRPVSANGVLDAYRLFVPYVIGALLYTLMVTIGFILLIVPGIVLVLTFTYYGYAIVDRRSDGPIAGLRRSAQITRGERWHLLGLGIVLILLNIAGLLVLIVGVLVTAGISALAWAYVYRQLDATAAPAQ
ncbi:MAG: hypothetical protein ACRDZO_12600 [Egibacteraceae bacterium]